MLRYLFLDMNSYFASVEQQDKPELRGRPVGVIPSQTDRTCCIAASYEAKAFGVRTGIGVPEARKLCPSIRLTLARPKLYVEYHHKIIAAVEDCLHVEHVSSIDELYCKLYANERDPDIAGALAHQVKRAIRQAVGPYVRCSIGLGPNVWLAKVATDLEKPDGLVMILPEQLPAKICTLKLTDLPGIAKRMKARLVRARVNNIYELFCLSEQRLAQVWGSKVHASIWYHQLRGYDLPYRPTHRRTVGHSHVLPPAARNREDAYAVLVRMIHKAASRMRKLGYAAGRLDIAVQFMGQDTWHSRVALGVTRDTMGLVHALRQAWSACPAGPPYHVSLVLSDLVSDAAATMPLFHRQRQFSALADVMDRIDERYGTQTVYSGAMLGHEHSSPVRISYTQIPDLDDFES